MKKKSGILIIVLLLIIFYGASFALAADGVVSTVQDFVQEKTKSWYDASDVDFFYADNLYGTLAYILNYFFTQIYGGYLENYKTFTNSLYFMGMSFYLIMGLRGKLDKTAPGMVRTAVVGTLAYHTVTNADVFKTYIYEYAFMFPKQVQAFFFSVKLPVLKGVDELNSDHLFEAIISYLWKHAGSSFSLWPTDYMGRALATFYCLVIVVVFIYYLMFWIIQFSFLLSMFLYMVVGVPIIALSAFKSTQTVFFEWVRGMATLILYPVFSTILAFVVNNILFWVVADLAMMNEPGEKVASPVIVALTVVILGFLFLRQVPNFAATLTRGSGNMGVDPMGPIGMLKGGIMKEIDFYRQKDMMQPNQGGEEESKGGGRGKQVAGELAANMAMPGSTLAARAGMAAFRKGSQSYNRWKNSRQTDATKQSSPTQVSSGGTQGKSEGESSSPNLSGLFQGSANNIKFGLQSESTNNMGGNVSQSSINTGGKVNVDDRTATSTNESKPNYYRDAVNKQYTDNQQSNNQSSSQNTFSETSSVEQNNQSEEKILQGNNQSQQDYNQINQTMQEPTKHETSSKQKGGKRDDTFRPDTKTI